VVRRRGRIDANQPEIVKALRKAGANVLSLASVGDGCPDLLVARGGRMILMEIKDGTRKPSEQELTDDERLFHLRWSRYAVIVTSVAGALSRMP
jgi:Holliday junction resolvase